MANVTYLLFGLIVIGGYGFMVQRGIEPFGASSERGQISKSVGASGTGNARTRSPTFIWFGGIGGK